MHRRHDDPQHVLHSQEQKASLKALQTSRLQQKLTPAVVDPLHFNAPFELTQDHPHMPPVCQHLWPPVLPT